MGSTGVVDSTVGAVVVSGEELVVVVVCSMDDVVTEPGSVVDDPAGVVVDSVASFDPLQAASATRVTAAIRCRGRFTPHLQLQMS
jgi:hypothetical protein